MCLFRCQVLRCLCRVRCGHGAAKHLVLLFLMTLNVATCMWTAAMSLLPRTLLRNVVGVCTLYVQMLFKGNFAVPFSVVWYVRTLVSSNCRTMSQSWLHLFTLWTLICVDSTYAAHVWQAKSHLEVVRFAGGLHRRCDLHAKVRWHWVRGHSRDLGHEAADALAKAGVCKSLLILRDWCSVAVSPNPWFDVHFFLWVIATQLLIVFFF